MTDAPERVVCFPAIGSDGWKTDSGMWFKPKKRGKHLPVEVAYVRADIHAAVAADLALARELIALLEEAQERDEARISAFDAKNADLKETAIAFVAVWGAQWSKEHGLPDGHMAAHFYDMLAKWGARVEGFTRAEVPHD
jgi:hypothetical protein